MAYVLAIPFSLALFEMTKRREDSCEVYRVMKGGPKFTQQQYSLKGPDAPKQIMVLFPSPNP
jgi:hypothetical protein